MKYLTYVETTKKNLFWTIIRYFRYFISSVYIHLIHNRKETQKKYDVSICAIFKNEGVFLKEWLEYHLLIGIDHFYMYNNFSDDNYPDILKPYVEKGLVTLIEWPVQYGQLSSYEDCFKQFRHETKWIGYIDLDEFVCLNNETDIKCWIRQFDKYPSVFINWKFFGTSGLLEHNLNKLVIEQYTSSWPKLVNSGKSFIRTNYDFKIFTCHMFYPVIRFCGLSLELLPINEFKKFIHYWIQRTPFRGKSQIQVNHYFTRSYAQHLYKNKFRGDACSAGSQQGREVEGRFERHETKNTVRDYTIQRFLVLLKLRMED